MEMTLILNGTPKEMADFVLEVRNRQNETKQDPEAIRTQFDRVMQRIHNSCALRDVSDKDSHKED